MEEQPSNTRNRLRQRLKKPYRLVILKEDSLEEVGAYTLTPLNLYILVSSILVGLAIVVAMLIITTPLKRWIPGYGDASMDPELIQLRVKVDEMEKQLELQKRYTDNVRQILTGEIKPPVEEDQPSMVKDSLEEVQRIEEDQMLRNNFRLGEGLRQQAAIQASDNTSGRPLEKLYFTPPVKGEISAGFMPDQDHNGLDILAPKNTPIKAVMDGVVILSDWTLETGNTIGIMHDNQVMSFYKHNSSLLKKNGAIVRAGEAIAIIGNTGTLSSGPHLHFELWYKGKPVDPSRYINF
ncbi:MAG: M23 family metallopeptidase [Lewinellaceae bacterium]|nr:M23 family metallopeptidase [Saprospiraceae bacterium]MCB9312012.1 M23 family metallopeptidase [Lewinellaceae bacterium]HRW75000.1 M23 family metallopeptidase [Saprospiraceae bacterium]